MTCPVWQRMLDQSPRGLPAGDLERHALACPRCAESQPELLLLSQALPHLSAPASPEGLAERITAALLADRPARAIRPGRWGPLAALAAAAASLLLAVSLFTPRPAPPEQKPIVNADRPSLHDAARKARQAGERLIVRTAEGTMDRASSLFPPVHSVPLEPDPAPALKPLRETADEVKAGMAPVTNSAGRAVNLFFRDLPLGLKPG